MQPRVQQRACRVRTDVGSKRDRAVSSCMSSPVGIGRPVIVDPAIRRGSRNPAWHRTARRGAVRPHIGVDAVMDRPAGTGRGGTPNPMPSAGVNRCFQSGAGGIASELWPRVLDLDERALFAEARRRTRLEDFADDETFHQALGRLISSYETEAHLKLIGRVTARQRTIRLLMNRLSLVEDRARRPEIAGQEIRSPLFLTGLPRSGTTLLHALLAQDPENRSGLACRRSAHRRRRAAAALAGVDARPSECSRRVR